MTTHFSNADLGRLRALREELLAMEERPADAPAPRYWTTPRDIELYDQVLAARIGWKWDAVLDECERRGALPEARTVVDFACGTGVATRRVLSRIPSIENVTLVDRDEGVREFARASIEAPEVTAAAEVPDGELDLVLVSHVLDELGDEDVTALLDVLRRARNVLWVEPGSRVTSRRLSAQRDALLDHFDVAAPCTHVESCGMLADGMDRHWCHLFAKPPAEVHTTSFWSEVHRELRIDLRSLPYSFVALQAKGSVTSIDAARLLGRPRFERGNVRLDLCDRDGVRESRMLQRMHKPLFKELKDAAGDVVLLRQRDREFERVVPSAE